MALVNPGGTQAGEAESPALRRILEIEVLAPADVELAGERYLVADSRSRKVLVFERGGRLVSALGEAGAAHRFLAPSDVEVAASGQVGVQELADGTLYLFEAWDRKPTPVRLPRFASFALDGEGTIWIHPEAGEALLASYSARGELQRELGRRKSFEDLYGVATASPKFRTLLNRVSLGLTPEEEPVVVFRFAPVIQKYSSAGELLWERWLRGREVEEVTDLFLADEDRLGRKYVRTRIGDEVANYVTLGGAVDPESGRIYVLLANQAIVELTSQGEQVRTFHPFGARDLESPFALGIRSGGPGRLILLNPLLPAVWELSLPR